METSKAKYFLVIGVKTKDNQYYTGFLTEMRAGGFFEVKFIKSLKFIFNRQIFNYSYATVLKQKALMSDDKTEVKEWEIALRKFYTSLIPLRRWVQWKLSEQYSDAGEVEYFSVFVGEVEQ